MKKSKKLAKGLITVGMSMMAFITSFANESTFMPGTQVNGLGITSMTTAEAKEHLEGFYNKEYKLTITDKYGNTGVINGSDIGFTVNLPIEKLQEIMDKQIAEDEVAGPSANNSYMISMENTYDEILLIEQINALSLWNQNGTIITQDARISDYIPEEPFTIVPEVIGNNYKVEETRAAILNAVRNGNTELDLAQAGCYYTPNVTAESQTLQQQLELLNNHKGTEITYVFGDTKEVLNAATYATWINGFDGTNITFDQGKVAEYVATLAATYDTVLRDRVLIAADGREAIVNGDYGWMINQAEEVKGLIADLQTGGIKERTPVYATTAASRTGYDWGATYVEIDLTRQHVYMIKDGVVVWDAPTVTGDVSDGNATPDGIYTLKYKESDRILRGPMQSNGKYAWESHVDYWMPFNGGIGLHDAKWRSSFGGEIYKTNGSHGCINLPPAKTKEFYDLVYKGIPVICYF